MRNTRRRHPLAWLLAACLLAGAGAPGAVPAPVREPQTPEPPAQEQSLAAVDAYLEDQLAAMGIPGAALVVVSNGRQVHAAAFGRADASGRPMSIRTPVLLASTSKSLTAIAVLQQVEAGRLALDEPVLTYLPWFRLRDPRYPSITVRHLLHQSSGLSTAGSTAFEAFDSEAPGALEQGVRDLAGVGLTGPPGESFSYSNANYNILGLLVQTVSGQPFGEYMREHVFTPLDMEHSHTDRAAARADGLATGHTLWFGASWHETATPAPAAGTPSIRMYASAQDLGQELTALLEGGRYRDRRLLGQESVETMLAPAIAVDESKDYAMAWFARPLQEAADPSLPPEAVQLPRLLEHQGEWGNTHTYKAMVPASGLGVALVINGNDPSAPSRLKELDYNVLRILHGQAPQPVREQEDWLQRSGWALALVLLLAELASLALSLVLLVRKPAAVTGRSRLLYLWAAAALALDGLLVWLCLVHAPARFAVDLAVFVRQLPDVGVTLLPALALAVLWPLPRTIWLLARARRQALLSRE
ncbi:serine hydrolase domain-containing protein [Arthrobacter mobilis]|uniref:Beta-lactamase family protein n=1 Tax=Arthrobacter mobilis TaxID=2724944 RepID=A0A7X6K5T9_9MICC|nr:serine hydrolase domain-containing protein [Arthrobacter mobilis]NKX54260.1 beta-lactamase family protein [Arthrobacter mobilis]